MNKRRKGFSRREMLEMAIGAGGLALYGDTASAFARSPTERVFTPSIILGPFYPQPSNNRLPEKTINKALQLLRTRYADFGPTLATEKLSIEGVSLSIETVRQLLISEGLWKAKCVRRPVIHQLRERRARLGELVQIDGSPHDWFEGRAPKCTLLVSTMPLRA